MLETGSKLQVYIRTRTALVHIFELCAQSHSIGSSCDLEWGAGSVYDCLAGDSGSGYVLWRRGAWSRAERSRVAPLLPYEREWGNIGPISLCISLVASA